MVIPMESYFFSSVMTMFKGTPLPLLCNFPFSKVKSSNFLPLMWLFLKRIFAELPAVIKPKPSTLTLRSLTELSSLKGIGCLCFTSLVRLHIISNQDSPV